MYKGFDTGYGSPFSYKGNREILVQMMEVNRWYKARHIGNAQYNRECIVESIQTLRAMRKDRVAGI